MSKETKCLSILFFSLLLEAKGHILKKCYLFNLWESWCWFSSLETSQKKEREIWCLQCHWNYSVFLEDDEWCQALSCMHFLILRLFCDIFLYYGLQYIFWGAEKMNLDIGKLYQWKYISSVRENSLPLSQCAKWGSALQAKVLFTRTSLKAYV